MELVEGRPLAELIKAGGLPLDLLLRIGVSISDAVGAAHQRGITHRDLKPANVMVGTDGRVKVLDFGLAKLREAEAEYEGETRLPTGDLTGEGRIIGTVAYMSPEQAEGKPVDSRSDIFSLGVLLHEMAVGERPFQGDTNVSVISSILKDTPSSITDLNPSLPAGLAKVVRRSLSKDPSRRYQSAIDLRNELEELKQESDSGITTMTSVGVPRPQPARRLGAGKVAAIAGSVLQGGNTTEVRWDSPATTGVGSRLRPRLNSFPTGSRGLPRAASPSSRQSPETAGISCTSRASDCSRACGSGRRQRPATSRSLRPRRCDTTV